MKVSNEQVNKILQSYTRQVEGRKNGKVKPSDEDVKAGAAIQKNDSVTITNRSDEVQKARELYNELPDVRRELVEEIKGKIKSGEYDVTSKEVADRIIHRAIVDKTV